MGTDIHARLRYKTWNDEHEYVDLPPVLCCRDYDFFAIIADVRNGYGFAGVLRYTAAANPITSDRGLLDESIDQYGESTSGFWYGDHSYTYITLQNLIDTDLHYQTVTRTGYVSLKDFLPLKREEAPENWCGDVSGQSVRKISPAEARTLKPEEDISYYIYHEWEDQPFIEKIEQLKSWMSLYQNFNNKPEDIILFMGFDS